MSEEMFVGSDFPLIGVTELKAKYVDRDTLRCQLNTLKKNWKHIRSRLQTQLVPFGELRESLRLVGAPTAPDQIGISCERLRRSAIRAQQIRRRFTILDIAVRIGCLEKWLDAVFDSNFWK